MSTTEIIVSLPDERMLASLSPAPSGVRYVLWDLNGPAPESRFDLIVPPYMSSSRVFDALVGVEARIVQSQAIGYDGLAERLPPGLVYCNAAGVHETSTAELALALTLASLRGIPDFVRDQEREVWTWTRYESLADRTVLVIGYGGIGRAAAARYVPFEVKVVRMANTAREDVDGHIHGIDELPALLPRADVVLLAVPLTEATTRLVDDGFLSAMKDGSLLVNVSRGKVVDTEALVNHASRGRIRAALDVTDPEPLPAGHPLWSTPGILISPHIGGNSTAMSPRVDALVRTQIDRILTGEEPLNIVIRS